MASSRTTFVLIISCPLKLNGMPRVGSIITYMPCSDSSGCRPVVFFPVHLICEEEVRMRHVERAIEGGRTVIQDSVARALAILEAKHSVSGDSWPLSMVRLVDSYRQTSMPSMVRFSFGNKFKYRAASGRNMVVG